MVEVSIYNQEDRARLLDEMRSKIKNPVYMCIGTEKVFADSLGPRVGTLINEKMTEPVFVYGIRSSNITAENLLYSYRFIKAMHPNNQIVVIDAAVGAYEQIGKVQLCEGGIIPGAATNKNLPCVGDISIVGIVADKGLSDFYTLNSEKDRLVGSVANYIAKAILEVTEQKKQATV